MKTFFAVLTLFITITARSQPAPTATTSANQTVQKLTQQPGHQDLLYVLLEKPNEITFDRVSCDGILVQLFKSDNPLQLINPLAPPEYGSSLDNLVLDPISQKPSGLRLLSIRF